MRQNILQLKRRYKNVLDLAEAFPRRHNLVDLRTGAEPRTWDRGAFEEKMRQALAPARSRNAGGRPPFARAKRRSSVRILPLAAKSFAVLLIVMLSLSALSRVGFTLSVFNDTENSNGNSFESGLVDFSLSVSPFSNNYWENLGPGASTSRNVNVIPEALSNPFFYYASSTNLTGDTDFCNSLHVHATLNGQTMYDGPLVGLFSATTTLVSGWDFEFTNNSPFFNSICNFDIDFNGWQTRHHYPTYPDAFHDSETTHHTIYSDGFKINKVYFGQEETKGGGCSCGDDSSCDGGEDGDGHHANITITNTNDPTTTNTVVVTSNTGGNTETGEGTTTTGDATSTAITTNVVDQNITIYGNNRDHKMTICHATGSDTNPYVRIVVDKNSKNGHFNTNGTPRAGHQDDLLLNGIQQCPAPSVHKKAKDNDWVELYNPNADAASIDGWYLCDGQSCDILHAPTPVPGHGFAIVAGSQSVFDQWDVPSDFVKIVLDDGQIGSGLDHQNDGLTLRRPDNVIFDAVNWGTPDATWPYYVPAFWNPGVPVASTTRVIARIPTGYDTNQPSDFHTLGFPTMTLLYPGHHVSTPWYWDYTYLVTWNATNANGDDNALSVDLVLIQDTNHNHKIDKSDTRIVLKHDTPNDGSEEITLPEGFLGFVWLRVIATGPENPMIQGFDTSGKIYDPFPNYMLEDSKDKPVVYSAIKKQIHDEGSSAYSSLLPLQSSSYASSTDATTTERIDSNASTTQSTLDFTSGTSTATTTPDSGTSTPDVRTSVRTSTSTTLITRSDSTTTPESVDGQTGTSTDPTSSDDPIGGDNNGTTTESILDIGSSGTSTETNTATTTDSTTDATP